MMDVDYSFVIVEVDDVKAELKIAEATKDFDDRIRRISAAVTRAIENYIGGTIVAREVADETVDGDGTATLLLKAPIIAITAIDNDGVTVDPTDTDTMVIYHDIGKVCLTDGSGFASGPKRITISYRYGYDQRDIPHDIRRAAMIWILAHFHETEDKRTGVSSRTHEDESSSFTSEKMPPPVVAMLEPYYTWEF